MEEKMDGHFDHDRLSVNLYVQHNVTQPKLNV